MKDNNLPRIKEKGDRILNEKQKGTQTKQSKLKRVGWNNTKSLNF